MGMSMNDDDGALAVIIIGQWVTSRSWLMVDLTQECETILSIKV
jgi:hypothetical protein